MQLSETGLSPDRTFTKESAQDSQRNQKNTRARAKKLEAKDRAWTGPPEAPPARAVFDSHLDRIFPGQAPPCAEGLKHGNTRHDVWCAVHGCSRNKSEQMLLWRCPSLRFPLQLLLMFTEHCPAAARIRHPLS